MFSKFVLSMFIVILAVSQADDSFTEKDCNLSHTEPDVEDCQYEIERYHWNNEVHVCVKVTYGGCGETKNNFKSKDECERIAKPVCLPEY